MSGRTLTAMSIRLAQLLLAKCIKRIPRQDRRALVVAHAYEIKTVPSSAMFVVLKSLMYMKMSSMARGMTPVSGPLPVMVWVFPLDVCPYANTVPKNREEETVRIQHFTNDLIMETGGKVLPLMPSMADITTCCITLSYRSFDLDVSSNT